MLIGSGAYLSGSSHIVAFCPKGRVFTSILAAQIIKFLFEPPGRDALEGTYDFSGRKLWRTRNEPMHKVRHHLHRQEFRTLLAGNFGQRYFQAVGDRTAQNLFALARYPHQMVVDAVDTVRRARQLMIHAPILFHLGAPVGGGASSNRFKRAVSAPQNL